LFQYHKFHLFTPFFKQWRYVFYIDCGAKIYNNIAPILQTATPDTLLAHSDAYPTYQWKLSCQFLEKIDLDLDLDTDYFQSTIMLFDTNIIEDNTFQQLYKLTEKYPVSTTNDQGILNLYFKKKWKQIPIGDETTYYYDFNIRNSDKPYIMTKYYVFND
jgi:lipopolysaccharide biosynthesis glycosyltransferase